MSPRDHSRRFPRTPRRFEGPRQDGGRPQGPSSPDSWEGVADWYDALAEERGTDFHQRVILPGLLRLLALRPGERALDVACGQGAIARAMHDASAKVTGIDLSPRLIEMARKRSPDVTYRVGDARRLEGIPDDSFDAAVCVLAAQNIDPVEPVWTACARVLRPGGRLVVVTLHPAFRIPRQSAWGWDESRKLIYRKADRYLSPLRIPIDMRPHKGPPQQQLTWTYHRPIQAYVNGLSAAGLWTTALEEWASHKTSQPGPRAKAENRARDEFPLFLAIRAVKALATKAR